MCVDRVCFSCARSVGGWGSPCHAGHTAGCHHGTFPSCLLFRPAAGDARHRRRASSKLLAAGAPACDGRSLLPAPQLVVVVAWMVINPSRRAELSRADARGGRGHRRSAPRTRRLGLHIQSQHTLILHSLFREITCLKNSFRGWNEALTPALVIINAF